MLDPIADKVLIGVCLLALARVTGDGWLFFLPALVIMTREFLISGIREFMAGRSITIPVSQLAKWKTTLQLVAIGLIMAAPVFPEVPFVNEAGLVTLWLAALITAQTGMAYFRETLDHV
jgi:CDP-diacylglycerol--glycerol-3-phosphate 3-phosphatidyltransferase